MRNLQQAQIGNVCACDGTLRVRSGGLTIEHGSYARRVAARYNLAKRS
jgi:hypothetical protein